MFLDEEEIPILQRLTAEERKTYTIAAIEKAKHTYQQRNKATSADQGIPASMFAKNQQQGETSKRGGNQIQAKPAETNQPPKLTKQPVKHNNNKQVSNCHTFINHALSPLKIVVSLMEMMKFPNYMEETVKILSSKEDVNNENDARNNEEPPVVYLGTALNKNSSQVDLFYLTLLINKKLIKNCMIDSGATLNIMFADVMKELGLKLDTPYGKCYAMDNRSVPIVGIIKNVEFRFSTFPQISYRTDITVVEISASYGMLSSRQWSNLVGGHVQLDLSYATIPIGGKESELKESPNHINLLKITTRILKSIFVILTWITFK